MTPTDFSAWLATMRYSNYRAAEKLGVSRSTIANWLNGTAHIGRPVGLACAALQAGLAPWGMGCPSGTAG